jgi:transcriptional regulator with PAS, ATPase and Fis domain
MERETPLPTENMTAATITTENMAAETLCKERLSGRKESDSCGGGTEKPVTLEQMEKKMMKGAIKRNKGNISLAAQELGITRQTLYNKGKKYKLFE